MKTKFYRQIILAIVGFAAFICAHAAAEPPAAATEKKHEAVKQKKPAEQPKKKYEPAGRFTPTEKLRADDVVPFPVDI